LYFGYKKTTNTDLDSSLASQWLHYDNVDWANGPCKQKDCYPLNNVGKNLSYF
jgi:hypothetical protein